MRVFLKEILNWWQCHVFGNDSYGRYLKHHAKIHSGTPPLDRRGFYLREQERKWSGVRRCC